MKHQGKVYCDECGRIIDNFIYVRTNRQGNKEHYHQSCWTNCLAELNYEYLKKLEELDWDEIALLEEDEEAGDI